MLFESLFSLFFSGPNGNPPSSYVMPSSLPIEDSEDSDSDGASEDGSLSDVYAYASNAGLVMQPHPVLVPVTSNNVAANVGSDPQAFAHSDPTYGSTRHRWTAEMVWILVNIQY